MTSSGQNRILTQATLVAPFPPPVGGVASLAQWLCRSLDTHPDMGFAALRAKSTGGDLRRNLLNFMIAYKAALNTKRGGIWVCFSSAYMSFYEKIIWAVTARILGRQAKIILVDGNFPRWWATQKPIFQWAVQQIITRVGIGLVGQSSSWGDYYKTTFELESIEYIGATAQERFFDLAVSRKTERNSGTKSAISILFVGWMIREKGVGDLMQALAMIKDDIPAVKVSYVGPTLPGQPDWKSQSAELGLSEISHFHGEVSDQGQLLEFYKNADIFVLPSHAEGFSVALVEAVASGLPTIASDVGGAKDTILEGQTGYVVESQSPDALAKAIMELCNNTSLRSAMSKKAASFAKDHFSHEVALDKYCAVFGVLPEKKKQKSI